MLPTFGANFLNPAKALPSGLVCSRLGSLFLPKFDGYLAEVAAGLPGFVHDPVTRKLKGLLADPTAVNYCFNGNDLSVAPWSSQYSATATANVGLAPDKTSTASRVTDTDANYRAGRKQSTTVGDDLLPYLVGGFVKKDTCNRITYQTALYGGVTPLEAFLELNPDTGESYLGGAGASAVLGYGVTPWLDDWFLLWLSIANNQTGNVSLQQGIYPSGIVSGTPIADQLACLAWGNFAIQAKAPTSHIPAGASGGSRSGDLYQMDLSTKEFDPSKGTIVALAYIPPSAGWDDLPTLLCLDGGSADYLRISMGAAGAQVRMTGYASGVQNVNLSKAVAPAGDLLSIAMRWETDAYDLFIQGVKEASATTGGLASAFNRLTLGSNWDGSKHWGAPICAFMYFPDTLTDAECIRLTEV